jgi:hypothetical protein
MRGSLRQRISSMRARSAMADLVQPQRRGRRDEGASPAPRCAAPISREDKAIGCSASPMASIASCSASLDRRLRHEFPALRRHGVRRAQRQFRAALPGDPPLLALRADQARQRLHGRVRDRGRRRRQPRRQGTRLRGDGRERWPSICATCRACRSRRRGKSIGRSPTTPTIPMEIPAWLTAPHEGSRRRADWHLYNGDCSRGVRGLPTIRCITRSFRHRSRASTPSPTIRATCRTTVRRETFWEHFRFLIASCYRATMPGRLVSIHCMQLPTSKLRDGYIGLATSAARSSANSGGRLHLPFRGLHPEGPVSAMQRTKAIGLLHKQVARIRRSAAWRRRLRRHLASRARTRSPSPADSTTYHGDDMTTPSTPLPRAETGAAAAGRSRITSRSWCGSAMPSRSGWTSRSPTC